jgi:hypothetical protein
MQYAYSQCPICLCTCDAFVDLAQYHAIVTVTTLPATQIRNQDSRASARSLLESSMNVNREQRRTSAGFYTNAIQNGNIASNSMTAANIGNDAALGQALFMLGNANLSMAHFGHSDPLSITCVILLAQHFLITVI